MYRMEIFLSVKVIGYLYKMSRKMLMNSNIVRMVMVYLVLEVLEWEGVLFLKIN